jgi:hypothetical protein
VTYNLAVKSISFTLAPSTPTFLIAMNPHRRLLLLCVNGTSPATFKFGSAPANETDGVTLGGASVSGGQGGSLLLSDGNSPTISGGDTPVDSIWAYSATGTTVNVEEGMAYAFL